MIVSIEILGFKAIQYAYVPLRNFQVMVGPNASGKSTFFDAFHFLRDILSFGLDKAVLGDEKAGVQQRARNFTDLSWMRQSQVIEFVVTFLLPVELRQHLDTAYTHARYEISLNPDNNTFTSETLWLCKQSKQPSDYPSAPDTIVTKLRKRNPGWRKIVSKNAETGKNTYSDEITKWNLALHLDSTKSALGSLPEDKERFPIAIWVKKLLMEGIFRIALNAEKIRLPSLAGSPSQFLPDGSNLPWVVHKLETGHQESLQDWILHLGTAIEDIVGVETVELPQDRSRYVQVIYSSGLKAPSWLLSDGTLRIMALTLLAYMPDQPAVITIEEPENGIHPQGIEAIMLSLQSVYDSQVFCATHSPVVLSMLKAKDLVCFSKTDGTVQITPGEQHPNLIERQSALHLGDLFALGVLG